MLKRIYIDNYKCLVNFELELFPLRLLLGENGSGKSSVFEVLRKLQAFIGGEAKAEQAFEFSNLCRWQAVFLQTFELDFENPEDGAHFHYRLVIEHAKEGDKARIKEERLQREGKPLFNFEGGNVQLYRDNSSIGPKYPFDWSQSGLATILPREDNQFLTWFKQQIQGMVIVQVIPATMQDESSERGEKTPSKNMENFVSWYRQLSQEQGMVFRLTRLLQDVLDGFESFRFEAYGTRYLLQARFNFEGMKTPLAFRFSELSDGQRMLVALYALLETARENKNLICIDEPENFVSLPEIQPWMNALRELCDEGQAQALLTSHHPEMIDLLASQACWFERSNGLATRISPLPESQEGELRVSELIARRWLDHE